MKITDAANLLALSGNVTSSDIKKAYRAAALKYHPDKNPAGAEMMKIINAAFDVLKDFSGDIPVVGEQDNQQNYSEALNAVLNAIFDLEGLTLEICGAWLWVTGETFKHKTVLKESGFKYASKKKSWYFRPENWKSASRGSFSMEEIRDTYGSTQPVKPSRRSLANHKA